VGKGGTGNVQLLTKLTNKKKKTALFLTTLGGSKKKKKGGEKNHVLGPEGNEHKLNHLNAGEKNKTQRGSSCHWGGDRNFN